MFYIVDKENVLVKEHENKASLRRVVRKSDNKADLRIVEGATLKAALKSEAKLMEMPTEPKSKEVKAPKPKAKKTKKTKKAKK